MITLIRFCVIFFGICVIREQELVLQSSHKKRADSLMESAQPERRGMKMR
jgi:hypothetical protein